MVALVENGHFGGKNFPLALDFFQGEVEAERRETTGVASHVYGGAFTAVLDVEVAEPGERKIPFVADNGFIN